MHWRVHSAVAAGAAATATWLAARDGRAGWTATVGTATGLLALASIRNSYVAAHPDRAERRQAKQQERVDAILERHERDDYRGRHRG